MDEEVESFSWSERREWILQEHRHCVDTVTSLKALRRSRCLVPDRALRDDIYKGMPLHGLTADSCPNRIAYSELSLAFNKVRSKRC